MKELTFSQWTHIEEIKLRGRVMTMSCDLEFLLLKIIVASSAGKVNEVLLEFKNMTMETKIMLATLELRNNHPLEYEKFKSQLRYLDNINRFRNKFAHCKIEWDKNENRSFFNILLIREIDGRERPILEKMTFTDFNERSDKMKNTILEILPLTQIMDDKIRNQNPEFLNPPTIQ